MVQCGAGSWNHYSWQGHLHSAEGKRLSRKQLTPGASSSADSGQYEHPNPVTLCMHESTAAVRTGPGLQIAFDVTCQVKCSVVPLSPSLL